MRASRVSASEDRCDCKVGRVVDAFERDGIDEELAADRRGQTGSAASLRDLAEKFNRAVLRSALVRVGALPSTARWRTRTASSPTTMWARGPASGPESGSRATASTRRPSSGASSPTRRWAATCGSVSAWSGPSALTTASRGQRAALQDAEPRRGGDREHDRGPGVGRRDRDRRRRRHRRRPGHVRRVASTPPWIASWTVAVVTATRRARTDGRWGHPRRPLGCRVVTRSVS